MRWLLHSSGLWSRGQGDCVVVDRATYSLVFVKEGNLPPSLPDFGMGQRMGRVNASGSGRLRC